MIKTIEKRESKYMTKVKEAMNGPIGLKIVPGMLTPREYVRRYIDQNGLSQREFNRIIGSHSTGFTSQVLSGSISISDSMSEKISDLIFSTVKDRTNFQALVIVDKTVLNEKTKNMLFRCLVNS